MILFLDFDGVLHPELHDVEVFCRVELLWKILRACPEVEVVFSTSWRELHSFNEMLDFVTCNGGEDLASRFLGITPVLPHSEDSHHRETECLTWLRDNKQENCPWLALDDTDFWFVGPNLYLVNHETGLTEGDAEAIVERLRNANHPI